MEFTTRLGALLEALLLLPVKVIIRFVFNRPFATVGHVTCFSRTH